jgi:hypothetical protein
MEDDNQINILDVIHGMNATDRVFYQTLRFLGSENDREALIATHQRNNASAMSLIRLHSMRSTRTVQYTATIPLTFPVGWDEPVVVRPTAAEIATATQSVEISDYTCSICQEEIEGAGATRLRFCGHSFHTACISEWFTQSVHCPMCRHDVRIVNDPPGSTSSAPGSGRPPASSRLAAWLVGANPTNHTVETAGSGERHV